MNRPTLKELYNDALVHIEYLKRKIERLEESNRQLSESNAQLVDEIDNGQNWDKKAIEFHEDDYDFDPDELYFFIEDIGLDPYDLPQSLGDRMALRDAISQTV